MVTASKRLCLACLIGFVASSTGCVSLTTILGLEKKSPTIDTSLLEAQGYSIPRGGMPSPVQVDPSKGPSVVLEIRGGDANDRHLESIPLPTDRAVTIERLVQQAQLHEQLGQLQIAIMRPSGQGAPIRLDSHTDDDGKVSNIGLDYALLPGDHIIVYSDERSMFERFIDQQFRSQT